MAPRSEEPSGASPALRPLPPLAARPGPLRRRAAVQEHHPPGDHQLHPQLPQGI